MLPGRRAVIGSGRRCCAAVLALALAACGGAAPVRDLSSRPDYLEADLPTLIEIANAWTAASIRIDGEMRLFWSGNEDDRHVNVRLFATRAGALRLRGSRGLVGSIFDLASDGNRFTLRIPSRETDYLGSAAAPAEPDPERPYFALRPHHITEVALPEPLPLRPEPGSIVERTVYPDRYAVDWWRQEAGGSARLRRRVWIERLGLRVHSVEAYGPESRIDFIAAYSEWLDSGYPGRILVERPWEELTFELRVEEVSRNPELPQGAFVLEAVPSYRTMGIEEAMAEARRERIGTPGGR